MGTPYVFTSRASPHNAHLRFPIICAEQDVHSLTKREAKDAKQPALERI
jgi:hypothetical protein